MTYLIFLTEKCTRNCAFCHVKKIDYIESIDNINKFIKLIKDEHNQYNNFSIDLFGGEPLINLEGIKIISRAFNDWACKINLITNADILDSCINEEFIERLNITITAYDIFINKEKYKKFLSFRSNIFFLYTFTLDDYKKIREFEYICKNYLKSEYEIHFSHDINSWNLINSSLLYNDLYNIYDLIFLDFYNSKKYILPSSLELYFKRYIQLLFDKNVRDFYCFLNDKKVFYHGSFIKNSCIRLKYKISDVIDTPKRCKECIYKKACAKSCVAEYINGDIPEKLCIYNKVIFDVINNNVKKYHNELHMESLIKMYLNEMYCH